ncbi:MAG: HAMP domain-containing histidine kinase [Erysipelotrichaceae bacterium]|nr:HAMP domain-containing histidine kinase [Erysipelotrichaceae bacterium]
MRRFKLFISRFSLSQQLFSLIFFFVAFFSAFFFVYLIGNVEGIIQKQMFMTLEHSQNNMIATMSSQLSLEQLSRIFKEQSLSHIFMNDTGISFTNTNKIEQNDELLRDILRNKKYVIGYGESQNFTFTNHKKFYYRITNVNNTMTLISITDSEYLESFKDTVVSSVINITVFVVGFFFIILMIWVASLIHPLNQIRNFIEQMKDGDEPKMKVHRKDEIGELADALVSMRNELKKQEKTKEEMIHNISHDLKTPIATIKSYGESIKDGIYPYETLEKSVDVIIDNADRLEHKVHSLLFLNRVEYLISQDCEGASVSMKEIVEKVLLNTKVIRPDIVVETDLEDIMFDGLEEPWRVTVENLIENAFRYANSKITIHLSAKDGLCIANDGPCMSEDRLRVLFKPFEKGQGGKFGLGLSIVSKVVRANHYQVSGENTSEGVIFRIYR